MTLFSSPFAVVRVVENTKRGNTNQIIAEYVFDLIHVCVLPSVHFLDGKLAILSV